VRISYHLLALRKGNGPSHIAGTNIKLAHRKGKPWATAVQDLHVHTTTSRTHFSSYLRPVVVEERGVPAPLILGEDIKLCIKVLVSLDSSWGSQHLMMEGRVAFIHVMTRVIINPILDVEKRQ